MKKLIIDINKHLSDSERRWKAVVDSVIASSRIEGITITKAERLILEKKVRARLKKKIVKKLKTANNLFLTQIERL
jgi:Fic family protein